MPCVLPVLSLKVLSVIGHGGGETRLVRHSFLVTASGILFSFLVLGGVTVLLQKLGMAVGWGLQFQQPMFLIFLVLLLTVFAANMWDLFEIQLPRFLADGINDAGYHPKLAGDFAAGAFATLLATPCSAPFLGTAISFALGSGPRDIMIIFAALGTGMILPYLAIALFPSLATSLPKPGRWMVVLRRLLGGALAVTAIWLLWVLSAQISARFAAIAGFCMLALLLLFGMRKTNITRWIVWFGLFSFTFLALGLTISGARMPKPPAEVERLWQPFSEMALAADLAEGKTVFVDVTADWCLTCKANKQFVLSQDVLAQRLFHSDIIAMQADMTNPNPDITEFLRKYGRYGIPFNAAFGPGAPQGIVLPELLTPNVVTQALDTASGR
jgi:suppressor for copper-sensitivity B